MKNNISARLLAMLLVIVMLVGILPFSTFAVAAAADTVEDAVYLSVSFDDKFVPNVKKGGYMNYVQVPLSELAKIDLNKYDGMADYIYDAKGGDAQNITVLHLFIYAHEKLHGGKWNDVSVSGGSGSLFFSNGLWGFDLNLTYNVNGQYPLYEDGYTGATADRIVLKPGDYVDLSGYTSWGFFGDSNAGFRYFMNGDSITHSYAATVGAALTVQLNRHKQEWGATTLVQSYVADAGAPVYYSKSLYDTEAPSVTTDAEGKANITFPEAGTYYIWSPGQMGVDIDAENIVSTPAYAKVVVSPAASDITAYWPNFRGNDYNMAITNVATPKSAETTVLKWAIKAGTGWANAPGVPVIVDNALVFAAGNTVYKLDLQTGEPLATGTLSANPQFATVPPTYADGLILFPLTKGTVEAVDAKTMKSVWVYSNHLGGQPNSPICCSDGKAYVGFWNGENKNADFVCLDVKTGQLIWRKTVLGGFYWAGGTVVGDAVIVGTDDGASGFEGDCHLLSLNKNTGAEISNLTLTGCGDLRSTISYSAEKGRVYFTTKNGYIGSAALNAATGELSDLKTAKHGSAQSTSTPLVYGDKVYYCCGSGVISDSNGSGNFVVANADTLEMLYTVPLQAYPQASVLLSTAYLEAEGKLYFYTTYNGTPGGITLIKIDPAKNDESGFEKIELFDAKGYEQYCIVSPICGPDGTIYYKNDSCNVMALCTNNAYLTGMNADTGMQKGAFEASESELEWVVPIGTEVVNLTPVVSAGSTYTINSLALSTAPVPLTNGIGSASIKITNGNDTRTYTVNIREISADATLSSLKVNESNAYSGTAKPLTPTFTGDTYYYGVYNVGSSRSYENVWPEANNANATVKVFAIENIQDGKFDAETKEIKITATNSGHNRYAAYFADDTKPMAVRIAVIAENGDTAEYVLVMSKEAAQTEGEALLAQIKSDDIAAAANKAAADAVIEKINAIGTVTLDSKAAIEAARAAYDALTDTQKALVINPETLTDAETAYANLAADTGNAGNTGNPTTGDITPIVLLGTLTVACLAGIVVILSRKEYHL